MFLGCETPSTTSAALRPTRTPGTFSELCPLGSMPVGETSRVALILLALRKLYLHITKSHRVCYLEIVSRCLTGEKSQEGSVAFNIAKRY